MKLTNTLNSDFSDLCSGMQSTQSSQIHNQSTTNNNKSFYNTVAKYKFNQKIYAKLEQIHSITGIHPKYIEFIIDKRTNEPLFSLHYTFFINKLKELGLLKNYSITLESQGNLVKCVFKCTYRTSPESTDYETFVYELCDQIPSGASAKSEIEHSRDTKRHIIMLQKSTVMNAIKFLFPDVYMEYNTFNKGNLGVWNQVLKTQTQNTKNEVMSAAVSKSEITNQSKTPSVADNVVEKYRKEFINLRESLQMGKDEFNKIVATAKSNLRIENPTTDLDFQRLLVEVNNIISQM